MATLFRPRNIDNLLGSGASFAQGDKWVGAFSLNPPPDPHSPAFVEGKTVNGQSCGLGSMAAEACPQSQRIASS